MAALGASLVVLHNRIDFLDTWKGRLTVPTFWVFLGFPGNSRPYKRNPGMPFRINFFLTQQGDRIGGWSENYWNSGTDLTVVKTATLELRAALMQAKGSQANCPRYRITPIVFTSSTIPPRSGKTYLVQGAQPRGGDSFPSDYQVTKLLLNFRGITTTTQQWFGGQVDDCVVSGGFYNPSASGSSLTIFGSLLASAGKGWSIYCLNPAFPGIPILSIDATTGTVTTGGHTFVTGDKIRISYVHGLLVANAIWKVIQIPSNTTQFMLAGWVPSPLTPFLKSPNARVRLQRYYMEQISQVEVVRSSNHRVGRPTGQFGGRPKRRRIG